MRQNTLQYAVISVVSYLRLPVDDSEGADNGDRNELIFIQRIKVGGELVFPSKVAHSTVKVT